jgi:hypothetical protein
MLSRTYEAVYFLERRAIPGHIPFCTNGIDLIDEDDTWSMLLGHTEQFAYKLRPIAKVFLDKF